MKLSATGLLTVLISSLTLTACDSGGSNSSPSPTNTDTAPDTYSFTNSAGEDTVSYTGQTARQLLLADMTQKIGMLKEGVDQNVIADLNYFFRFDSDISGNNQPLFSLKGGESLMPLNDAGMFTYNAVSADKDLIGKIAGGNGADMGETTALINNEFFGWKTGMDATPLPVELVDYFIAQIHAEATDGVMPLIPVEGEDVQLDVVYVDANGVDYQQLLQKFISGAVNFSQATNDYLQTDFANELADAESSPYTTAEHHWDEAFGYFGAARDYNNYTDEEISGAGGRPEYANGYYDTNGDGAIDVRSEYNFAHSTNCGKRDRGTANNTNPTNFSEQAFNAFLAGRHILAEASAKGELDAVSQMELDMHIVTAADAWERCLAATVVHYINEVLVDMETFTAMGEFQNLAHFKDLAKHWSEMKGFALGLQFSPESPFRDNEENLAQLRQMLDLMGDAPVLADGTRYGMAYGVAEYRVDLLAARDILQQVYGFDPANVEGW